jgi:hypothetical protein
MIPIEIKVFDFFDDQITAAIDGDPLFGVQLHDTVYQTIKRNGSRVTDRVIRISEAESEMVPCGLDWEEKDAHLILVLAARIQGSDKTERQEALTDVVNLFRVVADLFDNDRTLGDRVHDLQADKASRGYDVFDGDPYAVVNIPLLINPW